MTLTDRLRSGPAVGLMGAIVAGAAVLGVVQSRDAGASRVNAAPIETSNTIQIDQRFLLGIDAPEVKNLPVEGDLHAYLFKSIFDGVAPGKYVRVDCIETKTFETESENIS